MRKLTRSPLENYLTAVLFATTILAFSVLSIKHCAFSSKIISIEEKRRLEPLPHLRNGLAKFARNFEAFYNDRIPYRLKLVALRNIRNYAVFAVSGNPRVLVGKNRWFYYLDNGDLETTRHQPLKEEELNSWTYHFEHRAAWLARHDIKYVLFFAPSKSEIYPEFLPKEYMPVNHLSRQDQLLAQLRADKIVDAIDLRPALISAKQGVQYPLYFKSDTHWNTLGAFVAYRSLANHLAGQFQDLKPLDFNDINIISNQNDKGDLAYALGLNDHFKEKTVMARNKFRLDWRFMQVKALPAELNLSGQSQYSTTERNSPQLPKAFVICDSFMDEVEPFLSENFRRVSYYRWPSTFPAALIEQEKPDVVIEEVAERGLAVAMVKDPADFKRDAYSLSHLKTSDTEFGTRAHAASLSLRMYAGTQ